MSSDSKKRAVILLAEDDPGDQKLTKKALDEGMIDNDLYIVEDGEEALDFLLRRGKYSDPAAAPIPDPAPWKGASRYSTPVFPRD